MNKRFGIDLSTWQSNYPYSSATKDGVKFAILRAGFSRTKDNKFETHYKNAKKQGWGVGAYWYTYAKSVAEAKLEVKAFLKAIKGKKFEYPIYLDIEDSSIRKIGKSVLNKIIETFANEITKAGYYFGVYSNADWYRNVISGKELNKKYDWWIASWTKTKPRDINADLWQFGGSSNALRSNKVGGVVTDQNYAYKDYPSIMVKKGLNGYPKIKKLTYTIGNYKCLYKMNIRTGAGTIYRKKGQYKKDEIFKVTKVRKNLSGNIWGKTEKGYVCIKDKKKTYLKEV